VQFAASSRDLRRLPLNISPGEMATLEEGYFAKGVVEDMYAILVQSTTVHADLGEMSIKSYRYTSYKKRQTTCVCIYFLLYFDCSVICTSQRFRNLVQIRS